MTVPFQQDKCNQFNELFQETRKRWKKLFVHYANLKGALKSMKTKLIKAYRLST
jgi:hypothetical protein